MRARSIKIFDKAVAAMVAAIEVYNKPVFAYREETFAVLAINSWELLAKAKYLKDNNNKLTSLYVKEAGGTSVAISAKTAGRKPRARYKYNRAGNPMTHSLDHLLNTLVSTKALDVEAQKNLRALTEVRDNAIHFFNDSPALAARLQELGTAAVRNFVIASKDWFDADFSGFNFHLMPLAFFNPPPARAVIMTKEEKRIFDYIEGQETNSQSDRNYAVSVNVNVEFVKSKLSDAISVRLTNDPDALPVQYTEEQLIDKYPFDHAQLLAECRRRYPGFLANRTFYQAKAPLERDQKYAWVRLLDPRKPNSSTKTYYSMAVFTELDKLYSPK